MENPYAQPADPTAPPTEVRTSILAVLSLVSGILGLVVCCIPVIGLLGVAFGVPALFSISASRGRKRGTGMAIAGIVTGLIGAAFGTAAYVGGSFLVREFAQKALVFEQIEALDVDAVRGEFSPAVRDNVTAARLEEFRDAYQAEVGPFQSVPKGLGEMISGYAGAGQKAGQAMQSLDDYDTAFPVPVEFANDTGFAVIAIDEDTGDLLNVGVIVRDTGDLIWLLQPPGGP